MGKPKRQFFLITGIVLGLLIGLILKGAEYYIAQQLIELLQEETVKSCPCEFEVDQLNVSLLTLSALAEGARIKKDGKTDLEFKKLKLTFDIKEILEKKVSLSRLDLIDGFSNGVLGKSTTYKFIRQLTRPSSPEKLKDPNRWRIKLQELRVRDLDAEETIANQKINFFGGELDLYRDDAGDFILNPRIQSIKFNNNFNAGDALGKISIFDQEVKFAGIKINQDESNFAMDGTLKKSSDLFNFTTAYKIKSEDYQLTDWHGNLIGTGSASGEVDDATIQGTLELMPEEELTINIPSLLPLKFETFNTKYLFRHIEPNSEFKIEDLTLSNNNIKVNIAEDLLFDRNGISGVVKLQVKEFLFNDYKLENISAKVQLSGETKNPEIVASGQLQNLFVKDFEFPNTNWNFSMKGRQISLDLKNHNSDTKGSMQIAGEFQIPLPEEDLSVKKLNYNFSNYTFQNKKFDRLQNFHLSGQGELTGAGQVKDLTGTGTLSLSTKFFAGESALNGKLNLNSGILELGLANQTKSLSANLKYNLLDISRSQVNIGLKDFQTSDYHPEFDCLKTTLEANYNFDNHNFTTGDGDLTVSKIDLGCNQYALKLKSPNQIKIVAGQFSGVNLDLLGENSTLRINGRASLNSDIDLRLTGNLELQTLTILTPWLSDLRGNLNTNLNLRGTFQQPQLLGSGELTTSEFTFTNEDISGKNLEGKFNLINNQIQINKITGLVNNSPVELFGSISPFDLDKSELSLNYNNFKYEPNSEFFLESSGQLKMTLNESRSPVLQGLIKINEAILYKDIGIGSAIKYIQDYLLSRKKSTTTTRSLSNLLLDVKIEANRNLFIITSLSEAEMKGSFNILGTLEKPLISGKLETLYGWLGLRNSRFDLIEGEVIFSPGSFEPTINVLADTDVINRIGEPIYISMEAQGPLSSPLVNFNSDSNLNQQEILTLLTTRGLYRSRSKSSTGVRERINNYQDRKEQGLLGDIFSTITDLDSIAIEPAYNKSSGLIEPSLTRTRQINPQLSLTSETFLGGSTNDTRFVANYDLTPGIRLTALADTASTQRNTALEYNTSFTLLSRNRKYLDTIFKGDLVFKENLILNRLRLNSSSRLNEEDLPELTERLIKYYKSQGYYQAEVTLTCLEQLTYCQKLELAIEAKEKSKIINVEVVGDTLPDEIFNKTLELVNQDATQVVKKIYTEELVKRLRAEGFLQARIDTKYILDPHYPQATLLINLELGQPLSFIFTGNHLFSASELLEKTSLLSAKRFFGNNSINILIKEIEKLYHQSGYIFTVISSKQYVDNQQRLIVEIDIVEELPINEIFVKFNNIEESVLKELKIASKEYDPEFAKNLQSPKTVIEEELENNCFTLKNILSNKGYVNSQVAYQIIAISDLDFEINYNFEIPEQEKRYSVIIDGYPIELGDNKPSEMLTMLQIDNLIDGTKSNLAKNGYLYAKIQKTQIPETMEYRIDITPGEPVLIGQIDCSSDREINCDDILKIINLDQNQTASHRSLNTIKAKLLKSGLFEEVKVELIKDPSNSMKENLKIRTIEKNLTSLDVGFGVNSELGFHIFSEAVDRSLFKDGRTLSLRLDQYVDQATREINQGVAGLRYQDPYFLNQDLKFSSDLGYQKFDNPTLEYDLDRVLLDQSIQKSWRTISATFGYSFLNEQLDNVTPGAVLSDLDEGNLNLSYLYGNLNIDLRDDPSNPDAGLYLGFDYKLVSEAIESDADFYAMVGRVAWASPIFDSDFTLANNLAVGSAWTFNDTPEIPISQRYYLGGRNSVRGFKENSLGPKGADGAVIGGDSSLSNNFELRYHLSQYLQLHSFYDLGNVFLDDRSISYSQLRESAGLGFRFKSPIGPIGLDFGHPLDKEKGEDSWRIHFSVGGSF